MRNMLILMSTLMKVKQRKRRNMFQDLSPTTKARKHLRCRRFFRNILRRRILILMHSPWKIMKIFRLAVGNHSFKTTS